MNSILKRAVMIIPVLFIGFYFGCATAPESTGPADNKAGVVDLQQQDAQAKSGAGQPAEKGTTPAAVVNAQTQPAAVEVKAPAGNGGQAAAPPVRSIYLDSKGMPAGRGGTVSNPVSDAYRAGKAARPQALQDVKLPKDRFGLIDWAKIVSENLIDPKDTIDGTPDDMPPVDMDVIIETKSKFVDNVIFPHMIHTYWLKCDTCHPKIFVPSKGENKMSMMEMGKGKWCGMCHNKVAFPLSDCTRCHVKVKTPG